MESLGIEHVSFHRYLRFINHITSPSIVIREGNLNMVNQPLDVSCPDCGRPLKKNKGEAAYSCENSVCSVILVRYPDKPSIREIQREARFRP